MAPIRKRPRGNEDDDDEIIAVERASSSLRQDIQRKKARISVNGTSKATLHDDSESDSSTDSETEVPDEAAPPATQYELIRDNGFKHLANPDLDDQIATQRLLARKEKEKLIGDNRAADNAIVESITCINFMCHDKLHVDLGPLINFIVGHNGSGKSAVLTALTLCLGGKASATNRGANLKALIKEGRDQAMLIIKLKNEGTDAYQPDVFGKSIIIERHFSRTGTSSFKLKTATGRTISTKRSDVDDLVEYYQLQVDNPMNILTQDAAKSFITSSTPRQKYAFFMKGTQLDTLDGDYKIICDTCDSIANKLEESAKDLQTLHQIAADAEKKFTDSQRNEGLRARGKLLQRKLAWSQVVDLENALLEREERVAEGQRAIQDAERDAEKKSEELQRVEETLERYRDTERQLHDEAVPLRQEQETAKEAFDAASSETRKVHEESKNLQKEIHTAQNTVSTFQKSIYEEEKKLEEANGGAHARKQAEIEEAERRQEEAHVAVRQHDEQLPKLLSQKQEAEKTLNDLERRVNDKRSDSQREHRALDELNQSRGEATAGFHPNLAKLQQMIRADGGFSEKPIGPLGSCIRLTDSSWSQILEKQFGGALTGFIVTTKADEQRLSRLIAQANMPRNTPIMIVNHQALRQLNEPDDHFRTILRVLEFENELVRKALIITQGIEQTILVPHREEALNIMFSGSRPRNVKRCFCFHATIRGRGFNIGYGPNGSQTMDPIHQFVGKPRMKTDIESRVNYQRETVKQIDQQLAALETEKRQAYSQVQKCTNAITQHKRDQGHLKIAIQRAGTTVDNLKAELDAMGIKDGRLEGLKEELRLAEELLETYQTSYGDNALEKERLNNISTEKKRELEAVRIRVQEHDTRLKKALDKVRNTEQARMMVLKDKNLAINNVEAARARKQTLENKRDAAAAQVADWTAQAQAVADRVPLEPGETHAGLEVQYEKIKKAIKANETRQGATDAQIHEAFLKAKSNHELAKKNQQELEELHSTLKQAFMMRIEMFQRFQQTISARSRINFLYMLSERFFRGKLVIDHEHKKLDVHVEPDETNKSSKGRQTKGLSGGEKSFSSICLLLALWEAMSAPLRCLDEFDVFMDDVNRDVSTGMIISGARRSVGRQFILITPKALGAGIAAGAKDVKIIKLFDPRDKQQRIDEMMEN